MNLLGDNKYIYGQNKYGRNSSYFAIGDKVPDTAVNLCYFNSIFSNIDDVYDINNICFEYTQNYKEEIITDINTYNESNSYIYDVLMTNKFYIQDGTNTPLFYRYECRHPIYITTLPTLQTDLDNLVSIYNSYGVKVKIPYTINLINLGSNLYTIVINIQDNKVKYIVKYNSYDSDSNANIVINRETINCAPIYYYKTQGTLSSYTYNYTSTSEGIILNTNNMNEYIKVEEGNIIQVLNPNSPLDDNNKYLRITTGIFTDTNYLLNNYNTYIDNLYGVCKCENIPIKILSSNKLKIEKPILEDSRQSYDITLKINDIDITENIIDIDNYNLTITLDYYPLIGNEYITLSYYYLDKSIEYKGFYSNLNDYITLDVNPCFGHYFSNIYNINNNDNAYSNILDKTVKLIDKIILLYLDSSGKLFHTIQTIDMLDYINPFKDCTDTFNYTTIYTPDNYNINGAILLSAISITNNYSSTTVIDSRKRGGGIKQIPTNNEDGLWWDLRSLDGISYSRNGVFVVITNISENDLTTVKDSIDKYRSPGTLPIILNSIDRSSTVSYSNINNHDLLYNTDSVIEV